MYNHITLMGRIATDLELKSTPNGVAVLSFNLAVERSYTAKGEERATDFIPAVAWRSTAEFINRYFSKGRTILVDGELQTREYTSKDGQPRKVFEVIIASARFTGEKSADKNGGEVFNMAEEIRSPAEDLFGEKE